MGADVNKGNVPVFQFGDLPQLKVVPMVGLDMRHCQSAGPSVRDCSSHHSMNQYGAHLVDTRSAMVYRQFGEGPGEVIS